MKFHTILLISAVAAVTLLSGCKKKDKTEDPVYLSGTLTLDNKFPAFVKAGEVYTFTPSEITRKDDDKSTDCVGYCFYTSLNSQRDTTRHEGDDPTKTGAWTCTIPSGQLGSFTVYCIAFAKGYTNKPTSTTTTIIDPNTGGKGSLTGLGFGDDELTMTDSKGNSYPYVNIDGTDWMMQNLGDTSCGEPYGGEEIMASVFGSFYTWDEAMSICPAGWSLPSNADWDALVAKFSAPSLMADVYYNGNKMWEYWPKMKIDNASRLAIMPCGYAMTTSSGYNFLGFNNYAMFWTSDEAEDGTAVARYIYEDNPQVFAGYYGKGSIAASVRCIRK